MSKVQLAGNANGTGIFTIASPNSNTDRTLTLPDSTGTLLNNAAQSIPKSALPTGSVLQVVSVTYSTAQVYSNPVTNTLYNTGLTASITPTSSSSKVLVLFTSQAWMSPNTNGTWYGHHVLQRGGSTIVNGASAEWVFGGSMNEIGIRGTNFYLDSPASSSSVTYNLYWQQDNGYTGNLFLNRNSSPATMVLMEIAA